MTKCKKLNMDYIDRNFSLRKSILELITISKSNKLEKFS